MARISLSQIFNQGLRGILNVQSQTMSTQNQIATGKRVLTPSDDPVAAARILQLEQQQNSITQYKKNADSIESSLMLEETQLDAISNLLVRVRELAIQAGGGATTKSEREAIAAELSTRLDELHSLANSRSPSGEYIFGGFQGEQAPFRKGTDGTFSYHGDEGQRLAQISDSTRLATGDNGHKIFENIPVATVPTIVEARASAATTNGGGATIANGAVSEPETFAETFSSDAKYQLAVTDTAGALTWAVQKEDGSPVVPPVTGPYVSGGVISFGGADFVISDSPLPPVGGDTFDLQAPTAAISTATIVNRSAYEEAFYGGRAPFTLEITDSTSDPEIIEYKITDSAGDETTGNYKPINVDTFGGDAFSKPGTPITFGGVEFYIVDGAEGDSFQLTQPDSRSQSMLNTVGGLAQGLATLGDSPADKQRLKDLVSATLSNLENAEDQVGAVRAEVGARLNTLDSTRELHSGVSLVNDKILSEIRDVDYAEAITRLTQENFVLQAAQQSFAQVSKLSLFNFLR